MSDAPTPPTGPQTRVVVERPSTTGWVVAAIVAAIAIIAVAFMVSTRTPDTTQAQIANALEESRLQGAAEVQSSANAQAFNTQMATERAAQATQQAAAEARDSADQAAANVADAAQDASDRIAADNAGQPAPLSPPPQ